MGRKKESNATTEPITLAKLSELYLEHMQKTDKSLGTCFSYAMELKTAQNELGADTIVSEITPALIEKYNACDRVMLLKSGKPKAAPSYLKTQRVLRLALNWAAQSGLIATSPIPAKAEKVDVPAPEPETPAPKKGRRKALVEVVNEPQPEPAPAA